jgi:eukaryotic-like serine/threonine-protein kinase
MLVDTKRVQAVFLAATEEKDLTARAAFVDRECAADAALRLRVEALLRAHDQPESQLDDLVPSSSPRDAGDCTEPDNVHLPARVSDATLDQTPSPEATELPAPRPITEGPGTRIGPYKLREKIGEGGMGVVYLAEQEKPVRRRVALKIIKPGMDTEQVVARFEAERQALAIMDHPSIARVLDAGATETGGPYFVMELVKGVPITDYCDTVHLSPRERLELFVPVCQAIQHAHQKGIIHRDVKPSNVLVTMQDGKPVPKIIDFGIAKAIEQKLTERSLFTQHGTIMGTLEYMSPEQAELSAMDIDTRTDVYALGVLLYELLTGSTPLDRARLRQAGYVEILRRIREEEPPKPSTRLSESKESLPSVAAQRKTEPARLTKQVRGELDWIVMKAIEKDRTRRYETANGFARDIERYLAGDPVEAGPPSASYRLRKYARKHRAALVTAAAFAGLLATAAALSTWQAVRATVAERHALAEAKRAKAAESQTAHERDRAVAAEARTAHERDRALAAESTARDEAAKAKAVNEFLTKDILTQAEPENNAVENKVTLLEVLDRAAEKVGERFRDQPQVEAELRSTIAGTYYGLGSWTKAERQALAQLEIERRLHGADSAEALKAIGWLGNCLDRLGNTREAIELLEKAAAGLIRRLGPDRPETLGTRSELALAYQSTGRTNEAIAIYEEVLKLLTSKLGPDHPTTLATRHNLAWAYQAAGRRNEAIAIYEEVLKLKTLKLGSDHHETLVTRNNLALAYQSTGRTNEAIAIYEEVLKLLTSKLGPDHPTTLATRNNLAAAFQAAGQTNEAIAIYEEVHKLKTSKLGPDHPDTLMTRDNLAGAYRAAGRAKEAIAISEEVRKIQLSKLGPDHPNTLATQNNLAASYDAAGQFDKSEPLCRDCLNRSKKQFGTEAWRTSTAMASLGSNLLEQKKSTEAEPLLRECLAIREKSSPDSWATFNAHSLLGGSLLGQNKYAEAEPLVLSGYEGMKAREAKIPQPEEWKLTKAGERIVELYEAWGKPDQAADWRKKLGLTSPDFPADVFAR